MGFDIKPAATPSRLSQLFWQILLGVLRYERLANRNLSVHHQSRRCLCWKYEQCGREFTFNVKKIVKSDAWLEGYEPLRCMPIFMADGTILHWGYSEKELSSGDLGHF